MCQLYEKLVSASLILLVSGLSGCGGDGSANSTSAGSSSEEAKEQWEVGATVLALWSGDGYWYPAKIEKQVGEQYEVRHLDDATLDTVAADKLKADTLKEGDHVLANRRGRGSYYDGKITYREGDKLRIAYNGIGVGEENTTIAAVRVRGENTPVGPTGFLIRIAPRRSRNQEAYYPPAPAYTYQPSYSAPSYTPYTPSTPSYSPVAPSYTPQSGYSNGMSQNEYGMQQTDWSRKNQ